MGFNFFKKTLLKDVLLSNMIDIHNHVLPGIDDGSVSVENSDQLISALSNLGFSQIIATPHTFPGVWNNTKQSIEAALELYTEESSSERSKMIRCSSEYLIHGDLIEQAQKGTLLPLKDSVLLVEMSYLNPPLNLKEVIFELQSAGYEIVLAHPERYRFYHGDFNEYHNLKDLGCKFQLNLLSTTKYYGKDVSKIAGKLLKENLIDYVGTDVHHQRHIDAFDFPLLIKQVDKLQLAIDNNKLFSF
jgi:protein-tyrosine phosphatase